jgi:hypothetical protein
MLESSLVNRSPDRFVDRRRSMPPSPARKRSLAAAARAAFEVIGFVSVVCVLSLAISPGLRVSVGELGSSLWASFGSADDGTDEADAAPVVEEPRIGQPVVLAPSGNNVATYLARRYHVAEGAVRVVVAAAQSSGKERQVDPLLILAVVAVESSMNPFAQSPVGATGLMQVMPDLHGGKFVSQETARGPLDPVANIRVGSQILADLIHRGGSVERGLQLYVGAGNASDDGGYGARVLAELARLRMAANGSVAAALAAALRSDAHGPDGGEPVTSSLPGDAPAAGSSQKQRSA